MTFNGCFVCTLFHIGRNVNSEKNMLVGNSKICVNLYCLLSGCYFVQIQTQVIEDTFKMSKFKKSGNLLKCSVQHST
jgi:hypothetical protein